MSDAPASYKWGAAKRSYRQSNNKANAHHQNGIGEKRVPNNNSHTHPFCWTGHKCCPSISGRTVQSSQCSIAEWCENAPSMTRNQEFDFGVSGVEIPGKALLREIQRVAKEVGRPSMFRRRRSERRINVTTFHVNEGYKPHTADDPEDRTNTTNPRFNWTVSVYRFYPLCTMHKILHIVQRGLEGLTLVEGGSFYGG